MISEIIKNIKKIISYHPFTILTSHSRYSLGPLERTQKQLTYDALRCVENPITCGLCLQACPEGVLICAPAGVLS